MMIMARIAWKEFRGFLNSPVAYIFVILFVMALAGTYFVWGYFGNTFFRQPTTELDTYFQLLPIAFVLLVPALSMKLWPDELKSGTIEMLMSYPVKSWQVVMGKYMGGLYLIGLALLCTLGTPMVVADYGPLDWGPVKGAYLGGLLLGSTFLSIGLFMGALCKEQVSAFILTAGVSLVFVIMGTPYFITTLPKEISLFGMMDVDVVSVANSLSFTTRFQQIGKGVLDLADLVYFASLSVMFLVLNITVIECRKGR